MTETDTFLERIACELHELNATLNCRFDALDVLCEAVHEHKAETTEVHGAISLLRRNLDDIRSAILS